MPSANVQSVFKSSGNGTGVTAQWKRLTHNVTYDGVPVNTTQCQLQFTIPEDIGPPVLFYYHMTNFYQNHRRYVNSFFDLQLKGQTQNQQSVNGSNCTPLKTQRVNDTTMTIYPCGLIANSLFNDTFYSPVLLDVPDASASNRTYEMTTTGIAWASDKELYGNTSYAYDTIVPPPNWQLRYPFGYTDSNPPPDLATDEPFMVWMRTAALPDFSKLALRNDSVAMTAGTYQVDIDHSKCGTGGGGGVVGLCSAYNTSAPMMLTIPKSRLPHRHLQGHKVHRHLHAHCHRRPQPLPRHRLPCRRWNLHPARRHLHRDAPDQAEVCPLLLQQPLLLSFHQSRPTPHPTPSHSNLTNIPGHRKLGDHTYLSWNNTPGPKYPGPSTAAMASGRDLGRPGEA